MRRRDGETEHVGGADRAHRDQFGRRALRIGEMRLADLFANGDDDAFPADHRAEAERESDRDLHPRRDEARRALSEQFLVVSLEP